MERMGVKTIEEGKTMYTCPYCWYGSTEIFPLVYCEGRSGVIRTYRCCPMCKRMLKKRHEGSEKEKYKQVLKQEPLSKEEVKENILVQIGKELKKERKPSGTGAIAGFLIVAGVSMAVMGEPKGDFIFEAIIMGSAVLGAVVGDRIERGIKKKRR